MMIQDFDLTKKIFSILDVGIVGEYDAFKFTVEVFDNYQESEFIVTSNGVESDNPETRFEGTALYDTIENLKKNSINRGEKWKSFTMSYIKGDEVKTKFFYE